MWHAAHPQTSTHPTHAMNLAIHTNARINDQRAGESCAHCSSLITRYCLIQSLAKHNRKPSQVIENKQQRPRSIASFCRVFCYCQGKGAGPAERDRHCTRSQILIASPSIKNGRK